LKAEAMALWAVRSAQLQEIPPHVRAFLQQHEADEQDHLRQFESLLGHASHQRVRLPSVPRQWPTLAVQLYGYESLGLEFARLLAALRPDLSAILEDEQAHVAFFEREVRKILKDGGGPAEQAAHSAQAWWRKLPRTLDRYLDGEQLRAYKAQLAGDISVAIRSRFDASGLL
jgi:hypothetical protein